MANAPFVIQPYLTSIALAYRNQRMIADDVLPRVPVERQVFKYSAYTLEDGFTVPDTRVGRKSKPNEIDWTATELTDQTRDYGLEDGIPYADVANTQGQPATPINPEARSTELLTDLILLDREVRVANLVFDAAQYPTANKTTLSGTTQWSDFANSDPVGDILGALDVPLVRPNVLVLGRAVFTKLAQHPKIVKAYFGNAGDSGVVPRQFLAQLFELDDVLVGEGWVNTAKKGQAASMARVWGKHAALIYRNPNVTNPAQGSVTFGITAEWGTRIAGTRPDPDMGLRGGTKIRVGESVKELLVAPNVGYFFQNAVA